MNDADDAFELAERLIAQAKAEGWKFLNLSGDPEEAEFGEERRAGDLRLRGLTRVPDSLAEQTQLERLYLDQTQVADLTPLSGLTKLRTLFVSDTPVGVLTPLSGLTALRTLFLRNTKVADLSPLSGLSKLETVYFLDTPACVADPKLNAISKLTDSEERVHQLMAYLKEREVGAAPASAPPQQPGGVRFEDREAYLDPLSDADIGPLAEKLKPALIEALEALTPDMPGANQRPEPVALARGLLDLLSRDLDDIADEAHTLWTRSQKFGRMQESDDRVRANPDGLAQPMGERMREAVDNVIDVLPVFARQFAVCRELDDERGAWARDRSVEPEINLVFGDARLYEIVREEVADELDALSPPEEDGVQADKVAGAGLFTARNLVFGALGVVATAVATAVVTETVIAGMKGAGVQTTIEQKVGKWLRTRPEPIKKIMQGAPPDVRATVNRYLDWLAKAKGPPPMP